MDSLLWEEKLDRIKAFSIRRETRGFIHEECFDTHIELIQAEMPQTVCKKFCIASSTGRVLVSKTSGSGFKSLAVRHVSVLNSIG